jgi:hypothetical protein
LLSASDVSNVSSSPRRAGRTELHAGRLHRGVELALADLRAPRDRRTCALAEDNQAERLVLAVPGWSDGGQSARSLTRRSAHTQAGAHKGLADADLPGGASRKGVRRRAEDRDGGGGESESETEHPSVMCGWREAWNGAHLDITLILHTYSQTRVFYATSRGRVADCGHA